MNKETRYNQKLHRYETVDVCPHSSKRTCNGGFNSCISCPKTFEDVDGKRSFTQRLINFMIGFVLAIIILILCTM